MKKIIGILGALALGTATAWGSMGMAELKGTAPNSPIEGKVDLQDTPGGLHVKAQISHLPPGQHAFHIPEFGSCADMAKAAGSHYNPANAPHGQVLKTGVQHAHAGDLGNITADAKGSASIDAVIPGVTLDAAPYAVAGRAFIVHEKVDDFSQPAGNAGGRIACGPIVITGPAAPSAPAPAATK